MRATCTFSTHPLAKPLVLYRQMLEVYQGRITDAVWGQCRALRSQGMSVKDVANLLQCSRSVVYGALQNPVRPSARRQSRRRSSASRRSKLARQARVRALARKTVAITARKTFKRRGRPRKDGRARETYVVEKTITRAAFPSPASIARALTRQGIPVSLSTVRRDLLEMGFAAYKRRHVQALLPTDKVNRAKFCRKVLRNPAKFFESLIFTDEKWFDSNDHGDPFQWRRRHDARLHMEGKWCGFGPMNSS